MVQLSRALILSIGLVTALSLTGCATGQGQLFNAAESGTRADVEAALKQPGVNINAKNGDQNTPLIEAADANNLEAAKALLDAGADPGLTDEDKDTPMHFAVRQGR
jgi:ankyrin repeat protein